jgi:glutathione S-transferase
MSAFKFHYFDGRGRGELTRLIFVASGQPFEDLRISYETEWPQRKNETPIGQMPYLEYNGTVLPQSIAIARFIAKENNLAGKDSLEQVSIIYI